MVKMIYSPEEKREIKHIATLSFNWAALKNSTILISGATGFIGSLLIEVLEQRNKLGDNIKIVALSRDEHRDTDTVKYIRADITKELYVDGNVDYVIHLASNTHPKQYADDPVGTITTNIIGCNNLLKIAVKNKARRFLLASSVEIYGNGTISPMNETYCGYIDCNTVRAGYNESKRASESLCQSYAAQYGIDIVIARFARVFGADKTKKDTKALAQFIDKAICGEDIVLKSAGRQRFSYCYVYDAVSALIKILTDGKSGEAYNVADDDDGLDLGGYARFIAALAGTNVIFENCGQEGASVVSYALLDCTKLKTLGWAPKYLPVEGISKTYKILRGFDKK